MRQRCCANTGTQKPLMYLRATASERLHPSRSMSLPGCSVLEQLFPITCVVGVLEVDLRLFFRPGDVLPPAVWVCLRRPEERL